MGACQHKNDGKATEWDNKFQAYNKATGLFYTISNDDNNLYLTIQATDPLIIRKITGAGIILTINSPLKKDGEKSTFSFLCTNESNSGNERLRLLVDIDKKLDFSGDLIVQKRKMDSLVFEMNTALDQKFKEVKISGANLMKDTIISIYNETGIKSVARFNNWRFYTCEMAIPLKYLASAIDKDSKINCNVRVESPFARRTNIVFDETSSLINEMNSATNFTNEYTLAKKP